MNIRPSTYGILAAAALGSGVLTWWLLGRRPMELLPEDAAPQPAGDAMGNLVQNRERADGVHPDLLAFLDWWSSNGPFAILVAPEGGVRRDAAKQQRYFDTGMSKARTLAQTPHGRGGAIDCWPVGFNPSLALDKQPDIDAKFKEFGRIAIAHGFTWGGSWTWKDLPHIELKTWGKLPYPMTGSFAGLQPLTLGSKL